MSKIEVDEVVNQTSSGDLTLDVEGNIILDADGTDIILKDGGTAYGQFFKDSNDLKIVSSIQDGDIVFRGNDGGSGVDVMRLDMSAGGVVQIGTTDANPGGNTSGSGIVLHGPSGKWSSAVNQDEVMVLNRMGNDGDILLLRQAGSTEGTISVSGSTVSYGGFTGLHESSGIATNTAIGTVVSTIDELDTYPIGTTKAGQTRTDHAKVKVSDTAGDKAVYGVVSRFDEDDKLYVASVGIGSVRVTGACAKGDLLESNGDGTAKVQSDDIVRSKTIGKVTIGNSNSGVKLVSCVLYCG
jgi:hypothetical protein